MTKQTWILLGAIAVLLAGFLIYSGTRPASPSPSSSGESPTVTVTTTSSSQGTVTITTEPAKTPAPAPSAPASNPTRQIASNIAVTAPVAGTQWLINQPHMISWSKDPDSTGQAYLVDAHSGQIAGWLSSNTGFHQTSFTWNGRDLYAARNSGLSKNVLPGQYLVAVAFDNKNLPVIKSGAISLIYPDQATHNAYTISIKNFAFSPADLSVSAGDAVTFVNNDTVAHEVVSNTNFGPFKLQPGESVLLDTSTLAPGTYPYESDLYPNVKGTLIVK